MKDKIILPSPKECPQVDAFYHVLARVIDRILKDHSIEEIRARAKELELN